MSWLAKLLGRSKPGAGPRGEHEAIRWLRKHGFRIAHRNLKIGDDEADIIAIDPDGRTIAIVEVKSSDNPNAVPELAVNRRKQFYMARLASNLLKRREFADRPMRFDVIAVTWNGQGKAVVRHIPGAFESTW
jgi:putative endonuclease